MINAKSLSYDRLVEAAKRYAAADRTDPFALRRAVTHIEIGLATSSRGKTGMDRDYGLTPATASYYDAEAVREMVKVQGSSGEIEVERVSYRSLVRP